MIPQSTIYAVNVSENVHLAFRGWSFSGDEADIWEGVAVSVQYLRVYVVTI